MDYTLREWVGLARVNGSIAEAAVQVQHTVRTIA